MIKPHPSRRRVVSIGIGTVAVAILLIGGAVWAWRTRSHANLLASIEQDPWKIIEASREGQITEDERDEALTNVFERRAGHRLDEYFALPEGKPRQEALDRMIDEIEVRRKQLRARSATQPMILPAWLQRTTTQPNGGDIADRMARMRALMDRIPPARRAQAAEFMSDMVKRRGERGLPLFPVLGGSSGG